MTKRIYTSLEGSIVDPLILLPDEASDLQQFPIEFLLIVLFVLEIGIGLETRFKTTF